MNPKELQNTLIVKLLSIAPAIAVATVIASSYIAQLPDTIAARVYGGAPDQNGTAAWRIVVNMHDRGYYRPAPLLPISIEFHGTILAHGTTDDEGSWEARIQLGPTTERTEITLRRDSDSTILLQTTIAVHHAAWSTSLRRVSPLIEGRNEGPLHIDLFLLRGAIAASFPERAIVRVSEKNLPVANARLSLVGDGITFHHPANPTTDAHGRVSVLLQASLPSPRIEVRATIASGLTGEFQGVLPVRPGTLWIDPNLIAQGTLAVTSPVAHRHAYIAGFNDHSRLFGARLLLTRNNDGSASATIPLEDLLPQVQPPRERLWVVASPDPPGPSTEVLAWPVATTPNWPAEAAYASTPLIADGMPTALAAAEGRSHASRLRALLILSVASIFEAGLIGLRARNAKLAFRSLAASQTGLDSPASHALVEVMGVMGGARFWVMMLIATFIIAIAFGSLAIVTWLGAT